MNMFRNFFTVVAVSISLLISDKLSGQTDSTIFAFGPVINPSISFGDKGPIFSSDLQLAVVLVKTKAAYQVIWSPVGRSAIIFGEYFVNKGGSSSNNPIGTGGFVSFDYLQKTPSYGVLLDLGINRGKQWLTPTVVFQKDKKPLFLLNVIIPFQWSWRVT